MDPAFLDRIDMKVFLGPPSCRARFLILSSCLRELMHKGIVHPSETIEDALVFDPDQSMDTGSQQGYGVEGQLWEVAKLCEVLIIQVSFILYYLFQQ